MLDLQLMKKRKIHRILAMGDWHGNFLKAGTALINSNFNDDDILICLGDYTDRGPENLKCMELVIGLSKKDNVMLLMGNHEYMLIEHFVVCSSKLFDKPIDPINIDEVDDESLLTLVEYMLTAKYAGEVYSVNGGDMTLEEITYPDIPVFREYMKVISNLDPYMRLKVEGEELIFVHAGINPNKPMEKQGLDDLLWIREEFYDFYDGDARIFVGHIPTQYLFYTNEPVDNFDIVFCDTGSFLEDGRVSVVNALDTSEFWQG